MSLSVCFGVGVDLGVLVSRFMGLELCVSVWRRKGGGGEFAVLCHCGVPLRCVQRTGVPQRRTLLAHNTQVRHNDVIS